MIGGGAVGTCVMGRGKTERGGHLMPVIFGRMELGTDLGTWLPSPSGLRLRVGFSSC